MLTIIAALAATALAVEAAPAAADPSAAEAKAGAKDTDPMVCRRNVGLTGSRMRKPPVCMKKSDWEVRERTDRETMDRVRSGSQTGNRTPAPDG